MFLLDTIAINLAERGMIAWFEAAENATTGQWKYAISDATLDLPNAFPTDTEKKKWQTSKLRKTLAQGHLPNSMRHYRSNKIEQWVGEVLEGTAANAKKIASSLKDSDKVFITRDLEAAKSWIRKMSVGDLRSGMLASSGARRLCADGIYVAPKSEAVIVNWMLQPSGDFRSSNMLEKAVTQYDIQGLEIDYSLVCWDADLRRAGDDWVCFNMVAPKWCYAGDTEKRTEKERVEIRRNTYRVLLTRSRKGMVIFVPEGDRTVEMKRGIQSFTTVFLTILCPVVLKSCRDYGTVVHLTQHRSGTSQHCIVKLGDLVFFGKRGDQYARKINEPTNIVCIENQGSHA